MEIIDERLTAQREHYEEKLAERDERIADLEDENERLREGVESNDRRIQHNFEDVCDLEDRADAIEAREPQVKTPTPTSTTRLVATGRPSNEVR